MIGASKLHRPQNRGLFHLAWLTLTPDYQVPDPSGYYPEGYRSGLRKKQNLNVRHMLALWAVPFTQKTRLSSPCPIPEKSTHPMKLLNQISSFVQQRPLRNMRKYRFFLRGLCFIGVHEIHQAALRSFRPAKANRLAAR